MSKIREELESIFSKYTDVIGNTENPITNLQMTTSTLIDELEALIEREREIVGRNAFRMGYFASGVRPTEDEVNKFDGEYFKYLQSIKKEGR